jgi:hypothetical protein
MLDRSGSALCALLTIAAVTAPVTAQDADVPDRVEVLLTVVPNLPDAARMAMMDETASIWRKHGVAIDWLSPVAVRPVARHRLRVLVVDRRESGSTPGEPFTVGELLRPAKGHPIAMMSIESARRLMASVRGRAGYDFIAVDHRRLGVLLGRALAHEIGHYLLDTHTHARSGLMRPRFDALEFTDLRDDTFALDQSASEWLKSRTGTFAYAP